MEHLPPVGWADVAPKADIHGLEPRFAAIERRFDTVATKAELQRELRDGFATIVAANTTIMGLVVAAVSVL